MSKRVMLVLAAVAIVGLAANAYAEVQNVKVSGDLQVQGIVRDNFMLKTNTNVTDFGDKIRNMLSTVRVRIDADLTDNVMTTVRLLNERVWDTSADVTSANDSGSFVNLDLAYVALKEFLYSPLSLTVGRQELRFGNGLVIGDPDTNGIASGHGTGTKALPNSLDDLSARKSFDAVRATLNYDVFDAPLAVDVLFSKISEGNVQQFNDVDLYGFNANYSFTKTIGGELYFFQRNREAQSTGATISNPERLKTVGARGVFTGFENWTLGLESAFQFGEHQVNSTLYPDENVQVSSRVGTNRKVTAYALQATANYVMPKKKFTPVLGGSYTFLSGDKYRSKADEYRGWDPMFEDQSTGTLYNKILGYSNVQLWNVNGSMKPADDVTMSLNYSYLRLNHAFNAPFGGNTQVTLSGVSGDPTYIMKGGDKDLGHEVDLGVLYDYTEDVQFGLNAGAFICGGAFASNNNDMATQVIGSMKVTF